MQILMQTERLILRRFTMADADQLYYLDNDPEVMRYINGGTPTPREVVENDLLPVFLCYDERTPGYGFWSALDKDPAAAQDFVGWFSFRPSGHAPGEAVLGYRLRRAAWGKGYATEGARALIRRGFSEWGVRRVVGTTYEYNRASRRVMEKLGMTVVRRFRITPADIQASDTCHSTSTEIWDGDEVEYALDLADWVQLP
jgi:RimJ/RimL family protein N-acetyltransferase